MAKTNDINAARAAEVRALWLAHNKRLHTDHVIQAARDPKSAMHSYFTWDVQKAAYECWTRQARDLIATVFVTIEREDGEKIRTREFVSVRADIKRFAKKGDGGYRNVLEVLAEPKGRSDLLAQAYADLEYFQQKYETLKELAGLMSVIKKLLRKGKPTKKVKSAKKR